MEPPFDRLLLLSALLEEAPIGLALLDPELRYILVNDKLAQGNGLSVGDHLGRRNCRAKR
jgi:PAS domain-containing protein